MTATVIPLRPHLHTPIGHVIRTGEMAHRQYEHLHAVGRLPAKHVIVDASRAGSQKEFIRALQDAGTEVILDTRTAELSAIERFSGMARHAPWAAAMEGRPLGPQDFQPNANIDLEGVTHLRLALDREGGKSIDIDYSQILPHTLLQDRTHRTRLMDALKGLPFDNLVLRLSGFGSNAGPLSVKRTFAAIEDLHGLGYPVLLDHIGGLVGLSALAFGVVSGIAHGIGERERFDARNWHKPPKERKEGGSFGRQSYIPLFGFDKAFRKRDLKAIAAAPGGRRLIACQDRECCPHGLDSMLREPRHHTARQQFSMIDRLGAMPDTRRVKHFLDADLRRAERTARNLARLKTGDAKLDQALAANRKWTDDMTGMFETLAERERRAPPPLRRRSHVAAANEGRAP